MAVLLIMNPLPLGITIALTLLGSIPYSAMGQMPVSSSQTKNINTLLNNPENAYLKVHYDSEKATSLASTEKYTEAINIIDTGLDILANISKLHRDWKPNLIEYKRAQLTSLKNKWLQAEQQQAKNQVKLPGDAPLVSNSSDIKKPIRPTSPYIPPGYQPGTNYVPPINERDNLTNSHEALSQQITNKELENKALIKALKDSQQKMIQLQAALANASTGQKVYKDELQKYQEKLAREQQSNNTIVTNLNKQITTLEAAFKKSETARKEIQEQYDRLLLSYKQNEQMLKIVTEERDALTLERDQLAALVELNSPEKTKNLLDRNLTLAAQLKEAQEKIAQLEVEKTNSKEQEAVNLLELEKTRTELAEIKLRLISIRDENIGYRKRITELNNKLVNTEIELGKKGKEITEDPMLAEENKLLRSTISKQLRILSVQEQSRALLIDAYKRQKINDPELAKILQLIDNEELIKLTQAEQNLLETVAKEVVKEAPLSDDQQAQLLKHEQELTAVKDEATQLKQELEDLASAASKKDKNAQKKLEEFQKATEEKNQEIARLEQELEEQKQNAQNQANLQAMLNNSGAIDLTDEIKKVAEQKVKADVAASVASEAFAQKRYAAAEQLYRTIIQEQPDHVPARINLGTILLQINLVDESIEHLKRATEIDKDSVPAIFMLGVAQYRAGLDRSAMQSFLETIQKDPSNDKAFAYMGILESCANNYKKAIQYFNKALDINPKSPDALFNLAWAYVHTKQLEKAKTAYDDAVHQGALPDQNLELALRGEKIVTEQPAQEAPAPTPVAQHETVEIKTEETPSEPVQSASVKTVQEEPTTPAQPVQTQIEETQPKASEEKAPNKEEKPAKKRRFRFG